MTEIVSRSAKRKRLYVRRFDHDDARRRHVAGETIAALAAEYGVTKNAVYQAVTPEKNDARLETKRRSRTTACETCGGPAMKLVGGKLEHNPDGRILCADCRAREKRERLRFDADGALVAVRCVSLDCANGERWQPPDHFARGFRFRDVREGGIHSTCRACITRGRRRYRARVSVPCDRCGAPRLPAGEKGGRCRDSGLCRDCWQESRKAPT